MKRDHDYLLDVCKASLGYGHMPAAPVTTQPLSAKQSAYDEAYWSVLEGRASAFWPTNEWRSATDGPVWDCEQYVALFNAVKLAASLIVATDAERWQVVMNALRVEADKFAEYVARKA